MNRLTGLCFAVITMLPQSVRADEEEAIFKAAWSILEKAEKWELFSLNPMPTPGENRAERIAYYLTWWMMNGPWFHDWRVLGHLTVSDAEVRKTLLAALDFGINLNAEMREHGRTRFALARLAGPVIYEMRPEEGWDKLLVAGGCFQPRHSIRAEHKGQTVDFLICFECRPIHVFVGGKKAVVYTTDSPQDAFDAVLKKANVPLGPRIFEKLK